ncbi:LamG domain-containing protein [Paraburkholderia tuberum]|uniref:Concanavalin A-like lectin/glucanases superfamily protein n=1 Tax=Paraburkholderia tuberum TaxID=157910 RepID=A0A1H1JAT9_9BURK|nr:LamG domain-containing protein [Paraburkholderia tuberum]SDR47003.1 Concanavalin A-like lectin/glucanases superfamily protein [Paraburkholderia tuberum]
MALLFAEGFDPYGSLANMQASRWGAVGAEQTAPVPTLVAAAGPFGTQALQMPGAYNTAGFLRTNQIAGLSLSNTLCIGFWRKCTIGGSFGYSGTISRDGGLVLPNSSNGFATLIGDNASGLITIYNPANQTALVTTGKAINDGNWHYIEASFVFSATSGSFQLYVDGVVVANASGLQTWVSGVTLLGTIGFGAYGATNSGNTYTVQYDDVQVWDNTGSTFNTFPRGPKRITTLNPAGAGSSTQFTPSSGSNYSIAAQAWGASGTLTDTGTGHTDLYTTGGVSYSPGMVDGVLVTALASNPAGDGAHSLTPKIQTQSIQSGASSVLTATATEVSTLFTADATGAALTAATINSMQIGFGD